MAPSHQITDRSSSVVIPPNSIAVSQPEDNDSRASLESQSREPEQSKEYISSDVKYITGVVLGLAVIIILVVFIPKVSGTLIGFEHGLCHLMIFGGVLMWICIQDQWGGSYAMWFQRTEHSIKIMLQQLEQQKQLEEREGRMEQRSAQTSLASNLRSASSSSLAQGTAPPYPVSPAVLALAPLIP